MRIETNEKQIWETTSQLLENYSFQMGPLWNQRFRQDPKQIAFVLSQYKFASKMIGSRDLILELACGEGIGATLLGEFTKQYLGVDKNPEAISSAQQNLQPPKFSFKVDNVLGKRYGLFNAVVSLNAFSYLEEDAFFETLYHNVAEHGVVVVKAPIEKIQVQERLKGAFCQVFAFTNNEEMIHTTCIASFKIYIACHKKRGAYENK